MNSQYDVYMCRSIGKRKETERQLADAELLRSTIDGVAFKFSTKDRYAGMGKCKSWTERYLGEECYFNAPK